MILIPFYILALAQLYFSWRSYSGGITYLRFFRGEIGKTVEPGDGFASVIVPCKGQDKGLDENLRALFRQEYPDYELIFVVESASDPALKAIEEVRSAENGASSKIVIAGKADGSGQKVHNLIEASSHVDEKADVIVFVDSDARPSPDWLARLTSSLGDGAEVASGYRWFVPERGGLASQMRSVWNASIASVLGPDRSSNFSWGGSTAISRKAFEELRVVENWKGKLADDFALTRMVRGRGGVRFVPSCLTATVEDCTFAELLEFTTRQMKITRVYRPDLWMYSFIGSALYALTVTAGVLLTIFGSFGHRIAAAAFLLIVAVLGTEKARLRLKAVRLALPEHSEKLERQELWQMTLWAATPILFLYNDLAALVSRRIVWRGIEYDLESAEVTRILGREAE